MANQEEKILIRIDLDRQAANKESQKLEVDLINLRKRQADLNKAIKEGSISQEEYAREIVAVKNQIRQKSAEQRNAVKISQAEAGSINALRAELADLTLKRNKVNQSTVEGVKRAAELDAQMKSLSERIKVNEEASDDFRRSVGNYTNSIRDAIGQQKIFGVSLNDVGIGFQTANKGIAASTTRLQAFKVALASTGIGLILIAIGQLAAYFTKTERGADKLNQILAAVGATFSVITDRASAVGETIYNAVVNPLDALKSIGNGLIQIFTNPLETIKNTANGIYDSVTGIGREIANEAQAAFELEKQSQDLRREQLALGLEDAKVRREISFLRTEAANQDKSALERLQLIQKANDLEIRQSEKRVALKQREVDILAQQQALGENLASDNEALIQQQIELEDLQTQSFNTQRELASQISAFKKEIAAQEGVEIEEIRINREIQTLERIEGLKAQYLGDPAESPEVRNAQDVADLRVQIAADEEKRKADLKHKEEEIAKEVEASKLSAALQTANMVEGATKEGTAAQKVAGIASVGISSYMGATAALAPPPLGLGPIAGIPLAIATVATGILNAAKIAGFARGGVIHGPGTGTSDSVPIMASNGEGVVTAKTVQMFPNELSAMNVAGGGRPFNVPNRSRHYALGGIIQAERNVASNEIQRDLLRAIQNMPAPIVDMQEFTKKSNRLQKKVNITSV